MSYSITIGPGPVRQAHEKFLRDAEIQRKQLVAWNAPAAELASFKKQLEDVDATLSNEANDRYVAGSVSGHASQSDDYVSVGRSDKVVVGSEGHARRQGWIPKVEPVVIPDPATPPIPPAVNEDGDGSSKLSGDVGTTDIAVAKDPILESPASAHADTPVATSDGAANDAPPVTEEAPTTDTPSIH